ncbi:hypothetical protein C7B65_18890 [Phormidesmis priestleyi ULC007]|uniref:Uncharacterized protein n=1 Tax=Phormidesmis priestleyi ULC007 TaxID=1920490 RepID=A0A2T1DA68_9CYAN|nr:hypothetical protein [Phormidesmis priestleyi]PSB17346.1 hypothetical protein C7B65_18890 [Phormidesmis priestleyi ULC007]PZO48300.1 MAG: hypothetical protein DCF14_17405 [Phormidesmis priestleyi]
MITVEFQAKVKNGVIVIPEEYKQELATANTVKVTVLKQPKQQILETDILAELMRNPISVPEVRSITRDEMHD